MTDSEFAVWASDREVPTDIIEEIQLFAASPEEMQEAFDAMEPAPPVYSLTDLVAINSSEPYGIAARAAGFIVVGGCPNGDPIAIDLTREPGSVWYVCHESMLDRPFREVSVRVAENLKEMFEGLAGDDFPYDYFMAKGELPPNE